jgi:hypothetical protein
MKYILFDPTQTLPLRTYAREEAFAAARTLQSLRPDSPIYVAPLQYMFVTEHVQTMLEGEGGETANNVTPIKRPR